MKTALFLLLAFSLLPAPPAFSKEKDDREGRRENDKPGDFEKRKNDDRGDAKRLERDQRDEDRRQRAEEKRRQDDQRRDREKKDEQDRRQQDQLRQDRKQQDDQRREDKRRQGDGRENGQKPQGLRSTGGTIDPAAQDDRENHGFDRNADQGLRKGGDRRRNDDGDLNGKDRDVQGFRDGDKGRNDRSDDRDKKPRFSKRAEEMGIRQLPPDMGKDSVLKSDRKRSVVDMPSTGPDGQVFKAKGWKNVNQVTVKNHMKSVVNNTTIINQVNVYNTQETKRNQYYWHTANGFKYCHYNDNWGQHWYGWHVGVHFFWTRYHSNYWWWYDTFYDRWCYWHNGWWWWRDPYNVRVVYIYDNDRYVPATTEGTELPPSNNTVVEKGTDVQTYRSKDHTRMVRVVAENRDAFLYDTAKPPSFRPIFLQTNVKEVRFSDTASGKPLQVMLTLYDGTFELYDAQGNPYGSKDDYPDK